MKKTSTKMKKTKMIMKNTKTDSKRSGRMERQPVTVATKSGKKITI